MRPEVEPSSWSPLLDEGSRRSALKAVHAIAEALPRALSLRPRELAREHVSDYVWCLSSAALFFAYLSQITDRGSHAKTAQTFLEAAIDLAGEAPEVRMSLYQGITGLAWTIHHLENLLETEGAAEATGDLDQQLLEYLNGPGSQDEAYDLMGGLVGLGLYGFESSNRPIVARVVVRLAQHAEAVGDGLTWHTSPQLTGRSTYPEGHYNLGLAHGVAGVIAFLARALAAGIETPTAQQLLSGTVRWLRRQRLGEGEKRVFPWAVAPGLSPLSWGYDPGWAYADAGIATALIEAARVTADSDLHRFASWVAEWEAERIADVPARYPGIGFGPAGYAQIFARLYQQTGRVMFHQAAQYSLHVLLGMEESEAFPGNLVPVKEAQRRREHEVDFLSGSSGIGLVLLAAASEVNPLWDRLLLLSPLGKVE